MSDRLTEAEIDELASYARNARAARDAWEARPVPALWSKADEAKDALRNYIEADDILALLAERRALREKAEALTKALARVVLAHSEEIGGDANCFHDDPACPMDDTCECVVRAALAQAEGKK